MLLACSLQKHVFLLSITAKQNVAENVKKKKEEEKETFRPERVEKWMIMLFIIHFYSFLRFKLK